jgi:hypothetical protein
MYIPLIKYTHTAPLSRRKVSSGFVYAVLITAYLFEITKLSFGLTDSPVRVLWVTLARHSNFWKENVICGTIGGETIPVAIHCVADQRACYDHC